MPRFCLIFQDFEKSNITEFFSDFNTRGVTVILYPQSVPPPTTTVGGRDRGTDGGTDDRKFAKIDVRGTSTKCFVWEKVGVWNVFKCLKVFDDHSLAAQHNCKKVISEFWVRMRVRVSPPNW